MDTATVQIGNERVHVYPEGGFSFERWVRGIGWVVDVQPSDAITGAALAVRGAAFPHLAPLEPADLAG